ncbi:MAG: cupin 2 protein [Deltaproteobacteria bacterium]|nr:cupin 2 protein [Deltaproteobacteria bacterium]
MKITDLTKVDKVPMTMEGAKGALKQIPLARADGVPHYSLRVFTIEPDGHTPYHSHPFEHMNYIIDGQGALVDADGTERPVKKGDFALVMPGEVHQYKNTSTDNTPLVMICLVPKDYE